jgi:hypothetical protein
MYYFSINISSICNVILYLVLILFAMPFVFPNQEFLFILIQFAFLIPLYLFFCTYQMRNSLFGLFLIFFYFILLFLNIVGLPGSISAWMAMTCLGYIVGMKFVGSPEKIKSVFYYFTIILIVFTFWVLYKNYLNPFEHSELSDYFQKSSINSVPLLVVSMSNILCTLYYIQFSNNESPKYFNNRGLLLLSVILAVTVVIIFDFRSGSLIFLSLFFLIIDFFRLKSRIYLIVPIFVLLLSSNFLNLIFISFVSQGTDDLTNVGSELAAGALRYDRILEFWRIAGLNKVNFVSWSKHFSVSALSDFIASLFPISLFFLIIPIVGIYKLLIRVRINNLYYLLIILTSWLSSLVMTIMQPDFFSMFSFFLISSILYFINKIQSAKMILK